MLSLCLALIQDDWEKELFTEFYHRYERKLYAVALRILRNPTLAEEAVSETFFSVAKNFQKFLEIYEKSCQEIGPWAIIIVKNASLRLLEKERRMEPFPEEWDAPGSEDVESRNGYNRLVELILALPEDYRRVLDLKFVAEYTSREIASQLGLSVAAVEKRIERGRKLLIEKLREEGYNND